MNHRSDIGLELPAQVPRRPSAAQPEGHRADFRSDGSFGWGGAFGTHFRVDPKAQFVGVFLVQAQAGTVVAGIQRDFETAVMQAVVE